LRVQRLNLRTSFGVTLAVIGTLVMLDVSNFRLGDDTILGNTLVLLNCLSYAIFLVISRPMLLRIPPMTVIAWSYLFGGTGVLLVAGPTLITTDYSQVPSGAWMGIVYIVLLATLTGYILNTWAIHRSSSVIVATYTTLQPVIAGVLAVLFLGEFITGKEVVGFVLIVAGLLWISVKRTPQTSPSTESSTE
jgi:drug/metabolite transporter (DMT)-like permease